MKGIFFITIISTICASVALSGCGKGADLNPFQKWHVVSDSTTSFINGVSAVTNYTGMPDDYFDFSYDDVLYIKEDNLYDTVPFLIVSNDQIILNGIGLNNNDETAKFSISTTNIVMTFYSSPAGSNNWLKRAIYLEK